MVVGRPDLVGTPRVPGLIVVPFTTSDETFAASPASYPHSTADIGGLSADSVALTNNVRALGVSRILGRIGTLSPDDHAPIWATLERLTQLELPI